MESALTLAAHSSKFLPVLHRPCLSIKNVNMHLAHVFQLFNFILGEREVEVILNFSRDSCVIFSSLLSHLSLALERRASVSLNKHLRTGSNKTVFYECELFRDSACLLGDPQGIQRAFCHQPGMVVVLRPVSVTAYSSYGLLSVLGIATLCK